MTYVALLRGINVGGNNKVDMRQLKAAFEAAGMTSVRTYINSGNVVFSTGRAPDGLAAGLEAELQERLGLAPDILLLDVTQLRTIVEAIPGGWTNDATMRCDVYFLWPDVDRPEVLDELPATPGVDELRYVSGAVIRRVDRADVTKSRLTRVVGTPLYKRMTTRNCNTARKLLELVEG